MRMCHLRGHEGGRMAHPQEKVGKTYKGLCETEGHDEDPTDDQDGLICQDRGSQPHLTDHQDRGPPPNLIDGQAEEPTVNQDGLICQDRGSQPNLIDGQAEEPTVNQEGLRQPESLEDASGGLSDAGRCYLREVPRVFVCFLLALSSS